MTIRTLKAAAPTAKNGVVNGSVKKPDVAEIVSSVLEDVKSKGDEAIRNYSAKFDKWTPKSFKLSVRPIVDIFSNKHLVYSSY